VPEVRDERRGATGSFLTPQRISAGILAILALIFVLQNRDDVTMQFLGIQVTATLWFASLALLVVGVLIGVLWTTRRKAR
jgi:lipopolysaccharide assembly protein A